jgi:hypothetical protein
LTLRLVKGFIPHAQRPELNSALSDPEYLMDF